MNILNYIRTPQIYFNKNLTTPQVRQTQIAFKGNLNQPEHDCFEHENAECKKVEYGTISYLKNKKFAEFKFEEPQTFSEALQKIKFIQEKYKVNPYGLTQYNYIYDTYNDVFSNRFKDLKFTKFLGAGNNALALETEDGKVLKIGERNHFSFRDNIESFDAPVFQKGNIKKFYHYYIQEKCFREGLTDEHVQQIKKMIEDKGYEAFDLFDEQIGFTKDGKLCLIDPECARDKKKFEEIQRKNEQWMIDMGVDIDYI